MFRKKCLTLILVLAFLIPICSIVVDFKEASCEAEPNDSFAQAELLSGIGFHDGAITSLGDQDWFKFYCREGTNVHITFWIAHDVDIFILNKSNEGIYWSPFSSKNSIDFISQYDGYYYIWLIIYSMPFVEPTYYCFEILYDKYNAIDGYDLEPNDISASASEIFDSGRYYGALDDFNEVDWYKINCNISTDFQFFLETSDIFDTDPIKWELYDSSFTRLTYGQSDTSKSFEIITSYSGYYYIKLSFANSKSYFEIFNLRLLFNQRITSESEPNENVAIADIFQSGIITGQISQETDTKIDYWQFYLTDPTTIHIQDVSQRPMYNFSILGHNYWGYNLPVDFVIDGGYWHGEGWYSFSISTYLGTKLDQDYNIIVTFECNSTIYWLSPDSGDIEFGIDPDIDHAIFNFTYGFEGLNMIEIWLNNINFGDVSPDPFESPCSLSITIPYSISINGSVLAELKGYLGGELVSVAQRNFNFTKLLEDPFIEVLQSHYEVIGEKLLAIIYDPNGDNSYSCWQEEATYSMSIGAEISKSISTEIGIGFESPIFEAGINFNFGMFKEEGYHFAIETSSLDSRTSSQASSNPDLIGPGRGDFYWGQGWIIPWDLIAVKKVFWNETGEPIIRWVEPQFIYRLNVTSEMFLNDANAPEVWRQQNVVHQGYPEENYTAICTKTFDGTSMVVAEEEETSTAEITHAFTLTIGGDVHTKISYGATGSFTLSFELKTKVYQEIEAGTTQGRMYTIYDDDENPIDTITNEIGYDNRFGTYVFRTISEATFTSHPWEYNTVDYISPLIYFPTYEYDTSNDGLGPCENDNPHIVVEIYEEDSILDAWINYTIDDGIHWYQTYMTEQAGNPGFWEGKIPAQEHGTIVQWYIQARDASYHIGSRKNVSGLPYVYTVLNRNPIVTLLNPNGGENFTGDNILIDWSANDPDDDSLTFDLAYNFNNLGWISIATSITGTSYLWNITQFGTINSVQIRITAHDEFGGSAEDTSDFIFVIIHETETSPIPLPYIIISLITALSFFFVLSKRKKNII
ncbi:MAG: hypothetical protein FK734_16660 [Asgard group archaeon]|nr:hypothetical protein [Asgard group archaeon]